MPQDVLAGAKVIITMADGSTFSASLTDIHEAAKNKGGFAQPKGEAKWLANKHYKYTITIKKRAISFFATLQDWATETAGDEADMDWD